MYDIFGKELKNYDVVVFPFMITGNFNKKYVELTYGIIKGKRIYTFGLDNKIVYKQVSPAEKMIYKVDGEIPTEIMTKIMKIKEYLS